MLLILLFYVLFVCKCVLYYHHRVSTQLQLTNISIYINIKTRLHGVLRGQIYLFSSAHTDLRITKCAMNSLHENVHVQYHYTMHKQLEEQDRKKEE